jgi:hypothetical protein
MTRFLTSVLLVLALGLAAAPTARAGGADKFEGTLPAQVGGTLVIEVQPEADEDGAVFAYGTITADAGGDYSVEIPEAVLTAAKLPAEGGPVKATLGEETEEFGFPMYRVTALEKK